MTERTVKHYTLTSRGLGACTLRRKLAQHHGDTLARGWVKIVGDRVGLSGVWSIGEIKSYLRSRRGRRVERLDLYVPRGCETCGKN